ncbi:MAG TPA: hypothetical protein VGB63_16255 [Pedobacter sp.]|jgi:hypothetical protein
MNDLDWGQVTPEGASLERNEFTYVYNHDLSSKDKVSRTIRFILGRLRYYDSQLPADPRHRIKFDLRGQNIPESSLELIRSELTDKYLGNLTIDFIKN